jgi:excisionase family DNA binding protein
MPTGRKFSSQRVKTHRPYTVDEAAKTLGVGKPTVRRWIKGGLYALTDRKPWLIQGGDLIDFLKARRTRRQKCQPDECFCVKCRVPRKPAGCMAEYVPLAFKTGNLRAICPVCFRLMHKRIRCDALEALRKVLTVTITQPVPSLIE